MASLPLKKRMEWPSNFFLAFDVSWQGICVLHL
jgi:hypothetical protein